MNNEGLMKLALKKETVATLLHDVRAQMSGQTSFLCDPPQPTK